eukprot:2781078-Amphidinium_carterae.1
MLCLALSQGVGLAHRENVQVFGVGQAKLDDVRKNRLRELRHALTKPCQMRRPRASGVLGHLGDSTIGERTKVLL